jgi:hypothetical protein
MLESESNQAEKKEKRRDFILQLPKEMPGLSVQPFTRTGV